MNVSIDMSKGVDITFEPKTLLEKVQQEIYILLNTPKGSVPCYREYGVNMDYLHRPVNAARTLYAAAITDAINKFIPDAHVRKITFADATEPSQLKPILEVDIDE